MELKYNNNNIEKICKKLGISLLVLHGSYAKGIANKDSDIDVGVLYGKKATSEDFFGLFNAFADVFSGKFDPVLLNNAEPLISYQVAIKGKPIYERTKGDFEKYRMMAIGRYFDTKKFRELEKEYIKRAVDTIK